jgi:hypothetical protein
LVLVAQVVLTAMEQTDQVRFLETLLRLVVAHRCMQRLEGVVVQVAGVL